MCVDGCVVLWQWMFGSHRHIHVYEGWTCACIFYIKLTHRQQHSQQLDIPSPYLMLITNSNALCLLGVSVVMLISTHNTPTHHTWNYFAVIQVYSNWSFPLVAYCFVSSSTFVHFPIHVQMLWYAVASASLPSFPLSYHLWHGYGSCYSVHGESPQSCLWYWRHFQQPQFLQFHSFLCHCVCTHIYILMQRTTHKQLICGNSNLPDMYSISGLLVWPLPPRLLFFVLESILLPSFFCLFWCCDHAKHTYTCVCMYIQLWYLLVRRGMIQVWYYSHVCCDCFWLVNVVLYYHFWALQHEHQLLCCYWYSNQARIHCLVKEGVATDCKYRILGVAGDDLL